MSLVSENLFLILFFVPVIQQNPSCFNQIFAHDLLNTQMKITKSLERSRIKPPKRGDLKLPKWSHGTNRSSPSSFSGPVASALKVSTPKPDAGDEHSDPGDQRPFSLEMGIGEIDIS